MESPQKMYRECTQCGTKAAVVHDSEDRWNSDFVAVLLNITFDWEHYIYEPILQGSC